MRPLIEESIMNDWCRSITVAAALGSVAAGCFGCSNLVVKKVPVDDRIAGTDCQQGFRYYLNRPYLVVKKPILVCENTV
jgi:hypothetical protein